MPQHTPAPRPDAPRRLYVRVDADDLATLARGGDLPAPREAFAVTDAVRAAFPDDDEEDLEYAAVWVAAGEDVSRRRLVVAVDVPASRVVPAAPEAVAALGEGAEDDGGGAYLVGVTAAIGRRDVVAVHVGEAGASPDDELDWYDASELGVLVG